MCWFDAFICHIGSRPRSVISPHPIRTCALGCFLSVLFLLSFYLLPKSFFHLFLIPAMVPGELHEYSPVQLRHREHGQPGLCNTRHNLWNKLKAIHCARLVGSSLQMVRTLQTSAKPCHAVYEFGNTHTRRKDMSPKYTNHKYLRVQSASTTTRSSSRNLERSFPDTAELQPAHDESIIDSVRFVVTSWNSTSVSRRNILQILIETCGKFWRWCKAERGAEVQAPRTAARVAPWNVGENEAAESRPAEFVVGNVDDDELEEPEELRKVTVGRAPTETQRGEREGENQSVSARGTGAQHQHRRRKRQVDQEQRRPESSRTKNEDQSPCLHSISLDLEGLQRQHFRAERVTEFGVTFFATFIEKTGMKRFINFRDSEPSILAPKDAAARSLPFVESILESCPVGDHRSNG